MQQFDPVWKEYQFQKKQGQVGIPAAPSDAAADIGADITPATNNVDKEAPYKNQNLPKKKKKKKESINELLTSVKDLKSRFDAQSKNSPELILQSKSPKFEAQSKIFETLTSTEEMLEVADTAFNGDLSVLSFYTCAISLKSSLEDIKNKLTMSQNLLTLAEMQNLRSEFGNCILLTEQYLLD